MLRRKSMRRPIRGGARPLGAAWTPALIGGVINTGWWRGDDVAHVANAISQVNDKSGNGRHQVQGTGAAQPTRVAPAISLGGQAGILADGTSDFLACATALSSFITASAGLLWWCAGPDIDGATDIGATNNGAAIGTTPWLNSPVLADTNSGGGGGELFSAFYKSSTPPRAALYNWDGTADVASAETALDETRAYIAYHSGGNIVIVDNLGNTQTTASGNTTALTGTLMMFRAGAATLGSPTSTSYLRIVLGELGICNTALDAGTRTQLMDYMIARYGL